jgi:uncharacterized membrane protein YkoI
MNFQSPSALSFGLMAALVVCSASAKPVELLSTPKSVQASIQAQVADGKLEEIDQTNQDGETTFDVSFTTKSDDEHGFTVADDGKVLSVEVTLGETPAAVQKTLHDQAAGWQLEEINKNLDDTEISYEVDVSKSGQEKSFTVGNDGTLLSSDVTLAETPPAIQTTINNRMADGTLQSVTKNFDPDGDSFDVEITTKDGGRNAFSVGMNGTVLSVEVSLDKIPPPARKTIEAKIGNGKILHISKSLVEKKDNVLPFEVEGRKYGKPFNFSVGPRGRFLGMDD